MIKTTILVIILAALVGAGIVFITKKPTTPTNQTLVQSTISASPSASPIPVSTLPPSFPNNTINEQTDLNAELNKLTPQDFTPDYQSLKNQVSGL